MRGQASFILIIGILLVIAIVIYYAFQSFTPIPVVGEEQKMVQDMIEGIITSGTELSLKAMEFQGGYLVPPNESVVLTYIGVPYWQICQNDISPVFDDIKKRFEKGILYYVNNHTQDIKDFFGKNLSLSNASRVEVNILDNKIDVAVYMSTKFQGYPIKQPYRISVPTKFKELFNFAKDTIAEINKAPSQGGRFFETFTVASIYNSEYLPTFGMLTKCHDYVHLTSQDISHALLGLAVHTITSIDWWVEMSGFGSYAIYSVNGKQYKNLNPRILFPDGFRVQSSTNVHITNNRFLSYFPTVPFCLTAYNIKYSFGYPLVINLNDTETGYDFNFAIYVNVKDMEDGECTVISDITPSDPCADLPCNAKIKIEDCSGNPLVGAEAYFGSCLVGTSDSSGWINDPILCGTHDLYIYYGAGYDHYSGTVSSSNLFGVTYKLCKINDLTVHFNERLIKGYVAGTPCYPCTSPSDCTSPADWYTCDLALTTNCTLVTFKSTQTGEEKVISNLDPEGVPEECQDPEYVRNHLDECLACNLRQTTVDYIPAGNYDITVILYDPLMDYKQTGHLETNFDLLETTKHLYINIPNYGKPTDVVSDTQKQCGLDKLTIGCSLQPVRQTA